MNEVKEQVMALGKSYASCLKAIMKSNELGKKISSSEKPQEPESFVPQKLKMGCGTVICYLIIGACLLFAGIFWSDTSGKEDITTALGGALMIASPGLIILLITILVRKAASKKMIRTNQEGEKAAEREIQAYQQRVKEWEGMISQTKHEISELDKEAESHLSAVKNNTVLPAHYTDLNYKYHSQHPIVAIFGYFMNGRADTVKEAINLYEAEEREAQRDKANEAHQAKMEEVASTVRPGSTVADTRVVIKFPEIKNTFRKSCVVLLEGNVIAEGRQGGTVTFRCDEPMKVNIEMKSAWTFNAIIVNPGDRLNIVQTGNFLSPYRIDNVDAFTG